MLSQAVLKASLAPSDGPTAVLPLRLLAPGASTELLGLGKGSPNFCTWGSCGPAAVCRAIAVVRAPAHPTALAMRGSCRIRRR